MVFMAAVQADAMPPKQPDHLICLTLSCFTFAKLRLPASGRRLSARNVMQVFRITLLNLALEETY